MTAIILFTMSEFETSVKKVRIYLDLYVVLLVSQQFKF